MASEAVRGFAAPPRLPYNVTSHAGSPSGLPYTIPDTSAASLPRPPPGRPTPYVHPGPDPPLPPSRLPHPRLPCTHPALPPATYPPRSARRGGVTSALLPIRALPPRPRPPPPGLFTTPGNPCPPGKKPFAAPLSALPPAQPPRAGLPYNDAPTWAAPRSPAGQPTPAAYPRELLRGHIYIFIRAPYPPSLLVDAPPPERPRVPPASTRAAPPQTPTLYPLRGGPSPQRRLASASPPLFLSPRSFACLPPSPLLVLFSSLFPCKAHPPEREQEALFSWPALAGKSRRRRAYPQQIVTTRLLYCLQDPFAQLSRLQRI